MLHLGLLLHGGFTLNEHLLGGSLDVLTVSINGWVFKSFFFGFFSFESGLRIFCYLISSLLYPTKSASLFGSSFFGSLGFNLLQSFRQIFPIFKSFCFFDFSFQLCNCFITKQYPNICRMRCIQPRFKTLFWTI